jgi:hypothetical protein
MRKLMGEKFVGESGRKGIVRELTPEQEQSLKMTGQYLPREILFLIFIK